MLKLDQWRPLYSCNSVTNRNGQQLTDFIDQFNLVATNTMENCGPTSTVMEQWLKFITY